MDMTEQVSTKDEEIGTNNEVEVFEDHAKTGRTLKNIEKTLHYQLEKEFSTNVGKDTEYYSDTINKMTDSILKIHGLHQSQFDFMGSAENLINAHILNDTSIDANANKSEKTIESIMQEAMAPMKKAIGYDELYRQMKKDWGKEEAKRLSGEMYSYALALADSTAILKPYCFSIDARKLVSEGRDFGQLQSKPCKHINSYISSLCETIHQMSNHLAGAIAIGTFFFDIAHLSIYSDNTFTTNDARGYSLEELKTNKKLRKYIQNCFQQFIHSVNHLSRNASESPFTNISVFDKPKLKTLLEGEKLMEYYPEKEEVEVIDYIMEIQKIFIEFFDKGDPSMGGMPYRFPVVTVNFSKDDNDNLMDNEFVDYMCDKDIYRYNIFASKGTKLASCCRLINDVDTMREYASQSNSFGGVGISLGSHRVVTINFNRIALEANSKEEYFKLLDQRIVDAAKILKSHKNLLQMLADKGMQLFISNGWVPMNKLFSTFGILGLVEANEYIKNTYDEYKADGTDFMKDALVYLNKRMIEESRKYDIIGNIEQIPAESMAVRLAKTDRLLFGEDKVPYKLYANQFIPLWKEASIWDKMMTDGYYNQLITGGGIVHAQIGERVTPKQAKKIIEFSIKSGCEHFALNAVYTSCDKGHTSFGKQSTCPACGSQNLEHYTRVVGFFTKVENWNPVRRDWEFNRRTFVKMPDENVQVPEIDTSKIAKHISITEVEKEDFECTACQMTETTNVNDEPSEPLSMYDADIILLTLPTCHRCPIARNMLSESDVKWVEISAGTDNGMKFAQSIGAFGTPTLYLTKTKELSNNIDKFQEMIDSVKNN